jgi:hypothetical protein
MVLLLPMGGMELRLVYIVGCGGGEGSDTNHGMVKICVRKRDPRFFTKIHTHG